MPPIASGDLKLYGCASRPDDDSSTAGGAIATAVKPVFTQLSADARLEIVSDNAGDDGAAFTVTIEGRSPAGAVISESKDLDGTTPVLFDATYGRILKITVEQACAGTVSVKQGAGGTVRATLEPGFTEIIALFRKSASEASQVVRYEKVFWKNAHGSQTLLAAKVKLTADPSGKIEIGVHTSQGDTATITNRKTAPSGITFVDDNVEQSVPSNDIAAAGTIGVWIKQTLAADNAPINSSLTVQLAGTTT